MQEYRVPFKNREEEKLLFNLSARQFIWLLTAGVVSLLVGVFQKSILNFPMVIVIISALPIVGMSLCAAFKEVRHADHYVYFDKHIILYFKYKYAPKDYLNYRKNSEIKCEPSLTEISYKNKKPIS